ncbi:MAG TPA: DUF1194 domain-containing protein [Beijerinckiaceae bacterium]
MLRFLRHSFLALGLLAAGASVAPGGARADVEVDLALVIAVDISYSMDPEELALQRQGFADAFRSAVVHDAIRNGVLGRVAVIYMEWAGNWDQRVMVPWTVIENPDSARAFADKVAAVPVRRAQRTSISGAIDFGVGLLGQSAVDATRRVIDISGDGANNQGRVVTVARDEAVAQGIVVNGLPIMLKRPGYLDIPDLDIYYRDCVIGGTGSFMVPVRHRDQFAQAIKTKIMREIADLAPPQPLIQRAQAGEAARANCLVGETQWRERMGN